MSLRIGIWGCGSIARKAYLPLLVSWPDVEIAGVCSRTQKSVDEVCRNWHIPFGSTDVARLIDHDIQAAIILTSTPAHFEIIQMLLSQGIDVYVEKPATESSEETRQLTQLAHQNNCIFMVGYNRRYAPLYRLAREQFSGRQIRFAIVEKHRMRPIHKSLFDSYLDDTIHQIDLLCYYSPNPQPLHTSYEIKDDHLIGAASVAKLENGGIGIIQTSLQTGAWQERVQLHTERLSVEVHAFRELRVKKGDHEVVYGTDRAGRWYPDLKERGFFGALEHFFDCVYQRKEPETNGEESIKTQVFMEKLVEMGNPV